MWQDVDWRDLTFFNFLNSKEYLVKREFGYLTFYQRKWIPLGSFTLSFENSWLSKVAFEQVSASLYQAGARSLHLQAGYGSDQVLKGDHQVVPLPRLHRHTCKLEVLDPEQGWCWRNICTESIGPLPCEVIQPLISNSHVNEYLNQMFTWVGSHL